MEIRPLSREEVRSVDRIAIEEFGISGIVLMENAGAGAARLIDELEPDGEIVVLCGKGNNAGDGYVIARHLDFMQRSVRLVSIVDVDELKGDAATNHAIAVRSGIAAKEVLDRDLLTDHLSGAGIIVDCLLGTGTTGAPRGFFADAIEVANRSTAIRIAIDIPSGMDCDSGEVNTDAIRANHTITFVAQKLAMQMEKSDPFIGNIHVVDIGVPRKLILKVLARINR